MRDMMRDQGQGREQAQGVLDASIKRLERALSALETRYDRRLKRIEAMEAARGSEGQSDRAQLIAELEAARARERALESIAAEASAALGRAAEEVRAALADPAIGEDVAAGETTPSLEPDGPESEDGGDVYLPQAAKG